MRGVVVVLFATVLIGAAPPSARDAAIEAGCRSAFKHAICSEALGRWLASTTDTAVRALPKTPTAVFDGFRGTPRTTQRPFRSYAPAGTFFVFGSAGPPRGTIVYDSRHRTAFFGAGCCSYFTTVLVSGASPPPVTVAAAALTGTRTDAGIRLGDSPADVIRVYGNAPLQRVAEHPGMQLLEYENPHPKKPGPCVQQQTFAFRSGKLVLIRLYNGC
ncbi:MAG: hypothetical protein QOF71_1104 [Candidatus Eremiobacteraeota bacterium]|nr:hypothetical protein [Candidatus Eremiobacteraeota bacterium]